MFDESANDGFSQSEEEILVNEHSNGSTFYSELQNLSQTARNINSDSALSEQSNNTEQRHENSPVVADIGAAAFEEMELLITTILWTALPANDDSHDADDELNVNSDSTSEQPNITERRHEASPVVSDTGTLTFPDMVRPIPILIWKPFPVYSDDSNDADDESYLDSDDEGCENYNINQPSTSLVQPNNYPDSPEQEVSLPMEILSFAERKRNHPANDVSDEEDDLLTNMQASTSFADTSTPRAIDKPSRKIDQQQKNMESTRNQADISEPPVKKIKTEHSYKEATSLVTLEKVQESEEGITRF